MTMRIPFGLLALAACLAACTAQPPATNEVRAPRHFDAALVARGSELAAIGNCADCHTAPQGRAYAGGHALHTPFGTVYGTNITPDPETGIGTWSEADFTRALREGLDPRGHNLYPAFPYDYFTRLSDADVHALYAFVMTREPVSYRPPANTVFVPRFAVSFWKSRYFHPGRFEPDAHRDAQWNRGAYLVESLAHCSACHTPRDKLGGEKRDRRYSGGEAGDWHAPALDASSPSPVPWNAESLESDLHTGLADTHAMTAGPMAPVVRNLAHAPEPDRRAIALYVTSLDTRSAAENQRRAREALAQPASRPAGADATLAHGARLYAGACADCHDRGRSAEGGAMPLPLATGLTIPTPRNLIHIVRDGIIPQPHESRPWMPEFSAAFSDDELADLVAYLRSLTREPPWQDVRAEVRRPSKEPSQ